MDPKPKRTPSFHTQKKLKEKQEALAATRPPKKARVKSYHTVRKELAAALAREVPIYGSSPAPQPKKKQPLRSRTISRVSYHKAKALAHNYLALLTQGIYTSEAEKKLLEWANDESETQAAKEAADPPKPVISHIPSPKKNASRDEWRQYRATLARERQALTRTVADVELPTKVAAPKYVPKVSVARFTPYKIYEAQPLVTHQGSDTGLYTVYDDLHAIRIIRLGGGCHWLPFPNEKLKDANDKEIKFQEWTVVPDDAELREGLYVHDRTLKPGEPLPLDVRLTVERHKPLSFAEAQRYNAYYEATKKLERSAILARLKPHADRPLETDSKELAGFEFARGSLKHLHVLDLERILEDAPVRAVKEPKKSKTMSLSDFLNEGDEE